MQRETASGMFTFTVFFHHVNLQISLVHILEIVSKVMIVNALHAVSLFYYLIRALLSLYEVAAICIFFENSHLQMIKK